MYKFKFVAGPVAVCLFMLSLTLSSCNTPKNVAYFQDVDTIVEQVAQEKKAIVVRPGDKLSIIVASQNPELSYSFNLPTATTRLGQISVGGSRDNGSTIINQGSGESINYYTVDPQGDIDFPNLGEIHVGGMTRSELAGYIKGQLAAKGLLKNAVVVVEFVNTGVNVMGEVTNPGRYSVNRDQLTILDALSLAGDLTIQGQRENVLVIREENGKRSTYRVDLTSGNFMNSPAYYLQQNDIVYVEPNGVKKRQTTVNGNNVLSASFWVSVASLLTSIAVLIFK
ncbi:MAG: polysaccharide biosynthesis/export family protein [Prevotella sp.]|nr:polysaccharide biosynthesis/export family protein [Prevotella sp.]